MGHTGNIKGGRGTYIGPAPTRPSDGAPGRSGRVGAPAGPGEEKTQIGRSPLEGGRTRTEVDREAAKTGIFD
ncbi:MAG TPA: hypothetical protein VLQ93_25060, partial [Myxococcaceae bacterium]|nr:hypothetical protein [Myxococcaceae bacterium]